MLETVEVSIHDEVSASLSLVIKNPDDVRVRWEERWGSFWSPQRAHDMGVEAMQNFGVRGLPPRLLVEEGLTLLEGYDLGSFGEPLKPLTKTEKELEEKKFSEVLVNRLTSKIFGERSY